MMRKMVNLHPLAFLSVKNPSWSLTLTAVLRFDLAALALFVCFLFSFFPTLAESTPPWSNCAVITRVPDSWCPDPADGKNPTEEESRQAVSGMGWSRRRYLISTHTHTLTHFTPPCSLPLSLLDYCKIFQGKNNSFELRSKRDCESWSLFVWTENYLTVYSRTCSCSLQWGWWDVTPTLITWPSLVLPSQRSG